MPRTKTGRQALVRTLRLVMEDSTATVEQRLEACRMLVNINPQFKKQYVKIEEQAKPVTKVEKKSDLLG